MALRRILPFLLVAWVSWAFAQGPETIDGRERLAPALQTHLFEEQVLHNKNLWHRGAFSSDIDPRFVPEARPRFALPYYLIPESEGRFLTAESLDSRIEAQISVMRDGQRFYKLFVHPESERHYEFLRGRFQYVSAAQTEFMASPTSSYRSLLTWNRNDPTRKPFIAKVSLDRNVIGSIDRLVSAAEVERSIANQRAFDRIGASALERMGAGIYPETAGLLLRNPNQRDRKIGGQLIREIPDSVVSGERRFISFSTLMSPERQANPLILDVIRASGLSSVEFFRTHMIDGYMNMFSELSLRQGLNFEPHSQNLSIEVDARLRPTGQWIVRDFGGVWPDMLVMMQNNRLAEVYRGSGGVQTFKMEGGVVNSISSYYFFYRRQVFTMLLDVVSQHDPEVRRNRAQLESLLETRFADALRNGLGFDIPMTRMEDNALKEKLRKGRPLMWKNRLRDVTGQADEILTMVKKIAAGEWVKMYGLAHPSDRLYRSADGLMLVSRSGYIKGFGLFTEQEAISRGAPGRCATILRPAI